MKAPKITSIEQFVEVLGKTKRAYKWHIRNGLCDDGLRSTAKNHADKLQFGKEHSFCPIVAVARFLHRGTYSIDPTAENGPFQAAAKLGLTKEQAQIIMDAADGNYRTLQSEMRRAVGVTPTLSTI